MPGFTLAPTPRRKYSKLTNWDNGMRTETLIIFLPELNVGEEFTVVLINQSLDRTSKFLPSKIYDQFEETF